MILNSKQSGGRVLNLAGMFLVSLVLSGGVPSSAQQLAKPADPPSSSGKTVDAAATSEGVGYKVINEKGKPPAYVVSTHQPPQPYTLGPTDILDIRVWQNADLTTEVEVGADGNISLPLNINIKVTGMTTDQLRDAIVEKLHAFINGDPQVSVILHTPQSHRFEVMGKVGHQGPIVMDHTITVLDAIAMAGGFQDYAKQDKMYVLRTLDNGVAVTIHVNYRQIIKGQHLEQNIELLPGDVVVVP